MNETTTPPETPRSRALRGALIAGSALLAIAAIAQIHTWRANRDRLLSVLREEGVATPAVEREVLREMSPHHARIDAARALVFHLLEAPPLETVEPAAARAAAQAARRARLERARALALDGLRAQPNNWQAAMLLGATTYLGWSMDQDPRLFLESAAWQEPLLKSLREAPAAKEPRRILASAYLELWPALAPERRVFARDLLGTVFDEDPEAFERLAPVWFEVAADVDEAFSLVPPTPRAWRQVEQDLASRGQLHLFVRARALHLASLETSLTERLREAMTRRRLGDAFHSRTRFARVIADAPLDVRFAPLVDDVLAHYPPGIQPSGTGGAMDRWLRWVLDWSEVWIQPLQPANLRRLSAAAERPDPPDAARAAVLGGELALAERLERLESRIDVPAWAPYLEAKAVEMLDRGALPEADLALALVDPTRRTTATYWLSRRRLAVAQDDAEGLAEAEQMLGQLRADRWPATAWRRHGDVLRLDLLPAVAGRGLVVETATVGTGGGVVRLVVDGRGLREVAVRRPATITLEVALDPDLPHRVEWQALVGRDLLPGAVRMVR